MPIMIHNTIRSSNHYQDKLFNFSKTFKNGLTALRKLRPPISVAFKRLDRWDRLNIPTHLCFTCGERKKRYPEDWRFKHRAYGKGKNSLQSKTSALMEWLERFSCQAFFLNESNFFFATYRQVKEQTKSDILPLPLAKNLTKNAQIREGLKELSVRWLKAFSLTQRKNILLPIDWFTRNTNGFASGNCMEEAILQGLCEVVERHVVCLIVERKAVTPLVDIRSIDNMEAQAIISKFHGAGIQLFIKNFSLGFKIPTIGILAYDPKGPKAVKVFCAAGTALSRDTALIRALTELAQVRAQVLFEGVARANTAFFPIFEKLKEVDYLTRYNKVIRFSDLPTFSNANFKIELETALARLKKKAFEVLVVDATHPVMKIPAVIVIALGARVPDWCCYNPCSELYKHYIELRRYDRSICMLKFLLRRYSFREEYKELLLAYGFLHEKLGRFAQAIKAYKKIVSLCAVTDRPALKKAYMGLMRSYAHLKNARALSAVFQELKHRCLESPGRYRR